MPRNNQDPEVSQTKVHPVHNHWHSSNTPLLITIAVLLALILLGGAFAAGRRSSNYWNAGPMTMRDVRMHVGAPDFGLHRTGSFLNTSDRIVGVVTAVNGSHFTVASNGSTKDVQTNSSTSYSGGSKVAVNDTVAVFGANSNGQFTADAIVINP